jgi:hypothetical protein
MATAREANFFGRILETKNKKEYFFKKPEKLLKTKRKTTWVAKNEPENEATDLVENKAQLKNGPKTNLRRACENRPTPS